MSVYKVETEDETYYINSDGSENNDYWHLYSKYQKKRLLKVHKQLYDVWFSVKNQMLLYISFNIPTDELMCRISKIFLLELRHSKQQNNDLIQRNRQIKSYKSQLSKLRNKIAIV